MWVVGSGNGDQRLRGYDGNTGAVIYAGGGPNELMSNTRKWNTGIVARGRIYFAADNKVYAFTVPTGTPTPTIRPQLQSTDQSQKLRLFTNKSYKPVPSIASLKGADAARVLRLTRPLR